MHGLLVAQLTKFQDKGGNLVHMSSPAAWVNLHSKCALEWWSSWGQEVPELQHLAMKLVPLLIGSGPAERTWKDVDAVLTKKRRRLSMQTCLDLVFVRTWLRRELKLVSSEELEVFKEWEITLLTHASFYDGEVEPTADADRALRVFEDRIEDWEMNAVDGSGPGDEIPLGDVKSNKSAKFQLQEKYKGLFFVDKDPNGDTTYYDPKISPDDRGSPPQRSVWEDRKIIGLIWENRHGWRLESKLCSDLSGDSDHYLVDPSMIQMIKESTRNRKLVFRSDM